MNRFVLVITPLNSIMINQCKSLAKIGINSCYLDFLGNKAETFVNEFDEDGESTCELVTELDLGALACGKYNVIYAHPEALISTRGGQDLLRDSRFESHLACIAVDEAHMMLEW